MTSLLPRHRYGHGGELGGRATRLPPVLLENFVTRTTNAIERRFVEVRRRTRFMGVLSDRTSLERILPAVLVRENWKQRSAASLQALTQHS